MAVIYKNQAAVDDIIPLRSVASQTTYCVTKPSKLHMTKLPAADNFYKEQLKICKLFKLFGAMVFMDVDDVMSSLADYDAIDERTAAKIQDNYKGRKLTLSEALENNPHVYVELTRYNKGKEK